MGNKKRKISDRITTYGLFIDPPLGRVGMTKSEAAKQGFDVLIAHIPMSKIARLRKRRNKRIYGGYNRCKTNQF
jgi:pyruvate/2-oxoglutarate dehydrogenase complex dihydrolipoamide dehydrogenase (E3) component